MKAVILICRILLGVGFAFFGSNVLFSFMTPPPFPPGSLEAQFMAVMGSTHWMTLVGLCQLLGGLFVLSGRMAPLGLVILAPVLVNILAFHICIQGGQGIVPGLVFTMLEMFLIYGYREYFKPLLTTRATPS